MTRVVIAELSKRKNGKPAGSVREKRLRNTDGKLVRVLSIDANSKTFDSDLELLFKRNVARARRENKKLLGSASGVPGRK
jgi:hypothetical protein